MATYTTAQGDTLITIAQKNGFGDWQLIWNHEKNAGLRAQRPNPMVLSPGDQVFLPPKDGISFDRPTAATHTFRVRRKTVPCFFTTYLKDETGKAYAGCKYELAVGDAHFSGTIGDDGMVSHPIDPAATTGELKLWPVPDDADEVFTWPLRIGHLDPIDTISGAQARLNNLGYRAGRVDGIFNDETKAALEAFQLSHGFEVPSGELDDESRAALLAAHNGV